MPRDISPVEIYIARLTSWYCDTSLYRSRQNVCDGETTRYQKHRALLPLITRGKTLSTYNNEAVCNIWSSTRTNAAGVIALENRRCRERDVADRLPIAILANRKRICGHTYARARAHTHTQNLHFSVCFIQLFKLTYRNATRFARHSLL